jgi:hypothetical protein
MEYVESSLPFLIDLLLFHDINLGFLILALIHNTTKQLDDGLSFCKKRLHLKKTLIN